MVIVETLLPVLLFLYARYIQGVECWNELTEDVFKHWWPMIKLAVPSAMMVVAECMSFEVITLASSFISLDHLAAQTILSTFTTTAYMIHFPISIAASTRVSTLIGEGRADAARTTAKVSAFVAIAVGCLLAISYSSLRNVIPALMTDNIDVISLASATLPFTGLMEICDAFAISCNSSLRGIGRQKIGGWAALVSYYVVRLSSSLSTPDLLVGLFLC